MEDERIEEKDKKKAENSREASGQGLIAWIIMLIAIYAISGCNVVPPWMVAIGLIIFFLMILKISENG